MPMSVLPEECDTKWRCFSVYYVINSRVYILFRIHLNGLDNSPRNGLYCHVAVAVIEDFAYCLALVKLQHVSSGGFYRLLSYGRLQYHGDSTCFVGELTRYRWPMTFHFYRNQICVICLFMIATQVCFLWQVETFNQAGKALEYSDLYNGVFLNDVMQRM